MGYAIAQAAVRRGAQVTLVTGPVSLEPPMFADTVHVTTAQEMYDAVDQCFDSQDIVVMAAAVADYRPAVVASEKIKKKDDSCTLELERTRDILGAMSQRKSRQFLCGFSMETEHMLENSKEKLKKKNLDMIIANNLRMEGAGFGTDTNIVSVVTPDHVTNLQLMSKDRVAETVFDSILERIRNSDV